MKKRNDHRHALYMLRSCVTFFLLIAFIITCCMLLFQSVLGRSLHITYTEENIRMAAILTMGNVIFLSLLCTAVDAVRRRFMVERPVRRITEAAEKIADGDFSVRIKPLHGLDSESGFDVIIDCFNRMAEELGGVETLRTDFIANVSHELKTPLSVIQNYGVMLKSPELPDEKRIEYAEELLSASRRLSDLITNILRLNRLENQQIYPSARRFDLGEQLCRCLLEFESTWERKNIEIETDIENDVTVVSDEELLPIIWDNLFSNALKFTEPGGVVSVSMKADGEYAVVTVKDTGCGISPETGKHIFEKFYQGDTSHASQGNGLGLALVKRVVDIVGADISVESEVGRGSAFTVRIDRRADEKAETHA